MAIYSMVCVDIAEMAVFLATKAKKVAFCFLLALVWIVLPFPLPVKHLSRHKVAT